MTKPHLKIKEPIATLKWGWHNVELPMSVAHKIQELLMQAILVDTSYLADAKGTTLRAYRPFEVPPVVAVMPDGVEDTTFNAVMLSNSEYQEWVKVVKEASKDFEQLRLADVLPPEQWKLLRGEEK
jgi:hypothetical protein